jgi:hypothetical protein
MYTPLAFDACRDHGLGVQNGLIQRIQESAHIYLVAGAPGFFRKRLSS